MSPWLSNWLAGCLARWPAAIAQSAGVKRDYLQADHQAALEVPGSLSLA